MRRISLLGLSLLAVVFVGCAPAPSLEGKWTVVPAEAPPIPATITATFKKPDQLSVFVEMEPEVPMAGKVKLDADVIGTWKLDGENLAVAATDTSINTKALGGAAPAALIKPIEDGVRDAVTKATTGKIKWDGPDKCTVTSTEGKSAVMTRVKG